jgi:polyferredoxin
MFAKHFRLRNLVQVCFALLLLYIGVQFIRFVNYYNDFGFSSPVARPAGVEGFLPISALVALKAWISTGVFDKIHPAGLIIFLAILTISLLVKKSFCSWLCPIGTLSEGLAKIGRFFFGRNFHVPKVLDYILRSLKYLILFFFANVILLGMSGETAAAFLNSPYNMLADIKMLNFFLNLSGLAFFVVGILVILSVLFENFWCRYLCPYGALLGLISMASPLKVTRNAETCIGCGACTKACPNRLEVAETKRVWSPECTGCQNCVSACPVKETLEFKPSFINKALSPKLVAVAVIGIWLLFVITAKLTGHWQTAITSDIYQQLIPLADKIGH